MRQILLVLIFPLLYSCSVTPRRYQKGFYVSRVAKSKHQDKRTATAGIVRVEIPETWQAKVIEPLFQNNEVLLATSDKVLMPITVKQNKRALGKKDGLCDQLLLRDGTELNVKVIEVSTTEIRYKKCDEPDGPLYIEKASNVFRIRYINGSIEVITAPKRQTAIEAPRKRTHPMAINALVIGIVSMGLIFTIIGSVAIGILAIIFGVKALAGIHMYPTIFTGEGLARTGLSLGISAILLSALYIALLIFSL